MTGHRPFSELRDGLRRRVADRDAERERIWHAINQAADEIQPTLFGSNLRGWLARVARPLIFGDGSSAGGASTREGEDQAGATVQPGPPAEVPTPPADLQRVLVRVFTALFPPGSDGPVRTIEHTELPSLVREVVVERDRLQAEISKWALRAYKAGVPVALDYETGRWSIRDESSAGGVSSAFPDPAPSGAPRVAAPGAPPIKFCPTCGTVIESSVGGDPDGR